MEFTGGKLLSTVPWPTETTDWTREIHNPNAKDLFLMHVYEGDGRPVEIVLEGTYPSELDGLAAALSIDMLVEDTAWIAKKLRGLANCPEAGTDFFATTPGSHKQAMQPSTVAYMARILLHRYFELGLLSEHKEVSATNTCPECGEQSLIKQNGCTFCESCGYAGECG